MSLMRLASKYHWDAVQSFHAAVLDRIEAGLANWGDNFSKIERFNITKSNRLPTPPPTLATGSGIIAVSGTVLAPAVIRLINREWNTFG